MPLITEPKNWALPVTFILLIIFLVKFTKYYLTNSSIKEGFKGLRFLGIKTVILAILILIAVGIGDSTNSKILKPLFGRARPCIDLKGVKLLISCSGSFSFPSSHAVNIFSIATVIFWQLRRYALLLFPIAIMVCYSRVYVGVHYPFDVAAGALYGIFCGGIGSLVNKKIFKCEKFFT